MGITPKICSLCVHVIINKRVLNISCVSISVDFKKRKKKRTVLVQIKVGLQAGLLLRRLGRQRLGRQTGRQAGRQAGDMPYMVYVNDFCTASAVHVLSFRQSLHGMACESR